MVPVSLLDRADVATLRAVSAERAGPFGTITTCLVEGGAMAFDVDDPVWTDRDRLIAGDTEAADQFREALGPWGWWWGRPGEALAQAVGAANAGHLEGDAFRAWCILGPDAVTDALVAEAAGAAVATNAPVTVAVTPYASAQQLRRIFTAAGWQTDLVPATDPVELMGALDHALHPAAEPVAVLAHTEPRTRR